MFQIIIIMVNAILSVLFWFLAIRAGHLDIAIKRYFNSLIFLLWAIALYLVMYV